MLTTSMLHPLSPTSVTSAAGLAPAKMTADDAVKVLRRKIGQRLKGGPHGLMRCWIQFRALAGSTKEGITFDEFARGLRNYDITVDDATARVLFAKMDKSGDGHIQLQEFVEHVMGRWSADANTFVDAHVHRGRVKMVDDTPHDSRAMTADEAVLHLRRKIGQTFLRHRHRCLRSFAVNRPYVLQVLEHRNRRGVEH